MRYFTLAVFIFAALNCSSETIGEFYVGASDALVVRAQPTIRAKALNNLPPNFQVMVLRYDRQVYTLDGETGRYAYITYNLKGKDHFGYVFSPFLRRKSTHLWLVIGITASTFLFLGLAYSFRKSLYKVGMYTGKQSSLMWQKIRQKIFIDLPMAIREHRKAHPPDEKVPVEQPEPQAPQAQKVIIIKKRGFGFIGFLGFLLILLIVLSASRPNIQDFEIFIRGHIRDQIHKSSDLIRAGNEVAGMLGVDVSQLSSNALIANTREESFVIFSIFVLRDHENRPYLFLGVAKNFIPLGP